MANFEYDNFPGRGNGYDYDAGMSVNALRAYEDGRKPLSKITADDLKFAGWTETKKLAVALAKGGFWRTSEWHHSGGTWYNRVDFYEPADLVRAWDAASEQRRAELKAAQKTKTNDDDAVRVRGEYPIWGGSRRRPRIVGYQDFEGMKRGNWIYLESGKRKKANGNHITYSEI
jgi:hypothetical protein|tara:strand:+ start:1490 stop:2008 length:519 start_codon:yes stop_codon:yes gene_type:complete